mmetsp:Transcript_57518/g.135047  ORF Transcript_57518/g.135047 Transcript_57518/m.135047 type:complete len:101 (-) Transcript_57518:5-307(-)
MKEESERILDSSTHLIHSLTCPTLEAWSLPCLFSFFFSTCHLPSLLQRFVKCIATMTSCNFSSSQHSLHFISVNTQVADLFPPSPALPFLKELRELVRFS